MVAWNDHRGPGGEIYVQRLDSLGAPQWTVDGVPLTGGMGGISQGAPIAVPDETGGAIVVWNDWRDGYLWKDLHQRRRLCVPRRPRRPGGGARPRRVSPAS